MMEYLREADLGDLNHKPDKTNDIDQQNVGASPRWPLKQDRFIFITFPGAIQINFTILWTAVPVHISEVIHKSSLHLALINCVAWNNIL